MSVPCAAAATEVPTPPARPRVDGERVSRDSARVLAVEGIPPRLSVAEATELLQAFGTLRRFEPSADASGASIVEYADEASARAAGEGLGQVDFDGVFLRARFADSEAL